MAAIGRRLWRATRSASFARSVGVLIRRGEHVVQLQLARGSAGARVRPVPEASEHSLGPNCPIRQNGAHGASQIELPIAVRIRARKLKKSPRRRMQHV